MMKQWWEEAQKYERQYTAKLVKDGKEPWTKPGVFPNEFFPDAKTQEKCLDYATGRTCLEVGSSIHPAIVSLTGAKELRIVEPMADQFRDQFQLPPNAQLFAKPGEDILPQWEGQIDGLIYDRNVIDHTVYPLDLLDMILRCAAPGCWLLHWSDIWHFPRADGGHRDITTNPMVVRDFIASRGFSIYHSFTIRFPDHSFSLDYGCLARKT